MEARRLTIEKQVKDLQHQVYEFFDALTNSGLTLREEREREARERRRWMSGEHQRKIDSLTRDIRLQEEKTTAAQSRFKSLQEEFSRQSNEALRHDGHFQDMDDEMNRDKLVIKFRQLYDEADLCSQKMEREYDEPAVRDTVESYSVVMFRQIVECAFTSCHIRLEILQGELLDKWEEQFKHKPSKANEGFVLLLKDLVRHQHKGQVPKGLAEEIMDFARDCALYVQLLLEYGKHRIVKAEEIMIGYIHKVVHIVWPMTLLSNTPYLLKDDNIMARPFDDRFFSRLPTSSPHEMRVSSIVWPALVIKDATSEFEARKEVCLAKGVVKTNP